MNMDHDLGAMDFIVALALFAAAAFTLAWALSPALRARIEKPSYRFRQNARNYDERLNDLRLKR